jgi:Rieske Fe-S protein
MSETTRRGVLAGAAGVGAAAVLAACGTSTDNSGTGSSDTANPAGPTGNASPTAPGGSSELAKTSEIPVGGGKVIEAQKIVVTQPTAGTYKAFSAVCTHAQCVVASVAAGIIKCPCHGSMYSATDGSVKGGPAPAPLTAKNITVQGDSITLA